MTLTDKSMEWLNQNRRRSYPMVRDEWRESISPESGLDCVMLDALVFDPDSEGDECLVLKSVSVGHDITTIWLSYGGNDMSVMLAGGNTSGPESFRQARLYAPGRSGRGAMVSIVVSSHAYILDAAGEGEWMLGKRVLGSRVVRLTDGYGVDGISTNGSEGVEGRSGPSVASGEVVLEDGYRTSPVVRGGRIFVRVGKRFGLDPCKFDFGDSGRLDCRRPLFFFCGQNAIDGGNVLLKGGRGISVTRGRSYSVRSGTCEGMSIPCVEIVAGRELLDICRPSD